MTVIAERVDEDRADDGEEDGRRGGGRGASSVRKTAIAADVISASTPVAYAPACSSTLAPKARVTTAAMNDEHEHERARRAGPVRGHAVARAGSAARC